MPPTSPGGRRPVVLAAAGVGALVMLIANPPGMDRGAKWRASIRSSKPDELATDVEFHRLPRDGLDVRCSDDERTFKACYVAGPKLEVDITGSQSSSRLADLLAEAYRKMGG